MKTPVALLLVSSSLVHPQDKNPLLRVESEGLEQILPSAVDRGLVQALSGAAARIEQWNDSLTDGLPFGLAGVAARVGCGPFRCTLDRAERWSARVQCATEDAEQARELESELRVLLEWSDFRDADFVLTRDGNSVNFDYGAPRADFLAPRPPVLPAGVAPALRGSVDLARLVDPLQEFSIARDLVEQGSRASFSAGYDELGMHGALRVAPLKSPRGAELDLSLLRTIPADAEWAYADTLLLPGIREWMSSERAEPAMRAAAQFLGHRLGDMIAGYAAPSVGGRGPAGTVVLVHPANEERLADLWTLLEDRAGALARVIDERARARLFTRDGAPLIVFSADGHPLPLEPTFTHDGRTLILALTPSVALAARAHAVSSASGLLGRADFVDELPADAAGLRAVLFLDGPELLDSGYGPASAVTSALANALRPDGMRAGVVMPAIRDVRGEARSCVAWVREVEAGVELEYRTSRSVLAHVAAVCGAFWAHGGALGGAWFLRTIRAR